MTRRSNDGPFLHLAADPSTADVVRAGLLLVGRRDEVLNFSDFLCDGPLRDVDRGAASRVAWWRLVDQQMLRPREARELNDAEVWKQVRADARAVVLWHSPHPNEHIYALRACWHLRRKPQRLYEVRLPPGPSSSLPAFYGAAGIQGPKAVAVAWPTRHRVQRVASRAARWVRIRAHGDEGPRRLVNVRVVQLPITAHDVAFIDACEAGWIRSSLVLARVVAHSPSAFGVLCWRFRELVRTGLLDGRGRRTKFALPNEVRLCVPTVQQRMVEGSSKAT